MIENELIINNNVLIELPPLKSNINFIRDNKSIYIDSDVKIRLRRFKERNGKDSIDFFHKMNEYQADCLLIKSCCDIIIQNDKNKNIITNYFSKDIIKS
jgi:dephospho-CoA kinase